MDVVVCDLGSRFLRAGKADPFPNDKEPWVVSCFSLVTHACHACARELCCMPQLRRHC